MLGDTDFDEVIEVPKRWGLWQRTDSNVDLVMPEDKTDQALNEMLKLT